MIKNISYCSQCPFYRSDFWEDERVNEFCSETNISISPNDLMPPKWCPLREAPITVSLVQVQNDPT